MPLSSYRRVVLSLVCALAAPQLVSAQGARILRPSRIADSSRVVSAQPTLAGFRIGEPTPGALARLGPTLKADTLGSDPDSPVSYTNPTTGVTLYATVADGVGIVMVTRREAGALAGVRVGDSRASVVARWGPPAAGGHVGGLWLAGDYVITLGFDDSGRVARLGIGLGVSQ
jgi:hypothetical protein